MVIKHVVIVKINLLRFYMKFMLNHLLSIFLLLSFVLLSVDSNRRLEAATVTLDPVANWQGHMNIYDLSNNLQFGFPWSTADLTAQFNGSLLILGPNSIGDPNPYWYTPAGGPGAVGNKLMEAQFYVEANSGLLSGVNVNFTGNVLSNTLAGQTNSAGNGWTTFAFIRDYANDFSTFNQSLVPLTPGIFSVTLATINDPSRHVQYGFVVKGPNVWVTDRGNFGDVQIIAVPEPPTYLLLAATLAILTVAIAKQKKVGLSKE